MSDDVLRCPFGHRINLNRPISREGYCRECKQLYNHSVCYWDDGKNIG